MQKKDTTKSNQSFHIELEQILAKCKETDSSITADCVECLKTIENAINDAKKTGLVYEQIALLHKLMRCYAITGNKKRIENAALSIIKLSENTTDYKFLIRVHSALARNYWESSDFENAIKHDYIALDLSNKNEDWTVYGGSCLNISSYLKMKGDFVGAIDYAEKAKNCYNKINDKPMVLTAICNKGMILFSQGYFQRAIDIIDSINPEAELLKMDSQLYYNYLTLSTCYYRLNDLEKAINYSLKAINICETSSKPLDIGQLYSNLGAYYRKFGNLELAENYLLKALKVYQANNDKRGISRVFNNLGTISHDKNDFHTALSHFVKAMNIMKELGNTLAIPPLCMNIGSVYANEFKDYDEALKNYRIGLDIAKKIDDRFNLVELKISIATALLLKEDHNEALKTLTEAEIIAQTNHYSDSLGKILKLYIEIYSKTKDDKNLISCLKSYIDWKEESHKSLVTEKIAEMQAKFETEQKTKEAELYRQKNLELEEKNREIENQKEQLQDTLDKLHNSEIRYNFVAEEYVEKVRSTLIGKSKVIQSIVNMITLVARSENTNVLITGETGTGKEIVARNIHSMSNRGRQHFYAVNCSAVTDTLFESQFFGHEKDAFTGANSTKIGWFEISDKSTLFLDEIGTLSHDQQAKLLRVLEERQIVRVGSHKEIPIDVRIISATNANLVDKVNQEEFRRDLYHRLAVFVINIPPLRERKDEIPPLMEHFVGLASNSLNKKISKIEKNIITALMDYDFPGNVRELRNMVERAVLVTDSSTLRLKDFLIPFESGESTLKDSWLSLADMEKDLIIKALRNTGFNRAKAAVLLNVNRKIVERKVIKYGITEKDM
ncbi:MAG: sigma 54-interacting transcriptional regulator [Candidatus Cloacimonetes bacterium]|nr:sigma 54-interacting transcriptional regulator [Candidatus Cloacimonadota bacterium]